MNLLSFLSIAIHPRVLGANLLLRYPGQRNPVSGAPNHSSHRDCPRVVAVTACRGCIPFPGTRLGVHMAIIVSHLRALVQLWVSLQRLSVAALKTVRRIRSCSSSCWQMLLTLPWPQG